MEHDKWIRKLVAILVEMGFEPQAPQAHRKFVYRGDKCKHEVNLVIQSHAKESSKKAIVGYVKRTLREAGADMEMISKLDKLAFGFIADGMSIDEIDDALFAALKTNETGLAAEIGIELGKSLSEPANKNYAVNAFARQSQHQNNLNQLTKFHNEIEDIIQDLFTLEIYEHIHRHGTFFIDTRGMINEISQLDDDISAKHQIQIKGIDGQSGHITLTCVFIDEIAAALAASGYVTAFKADVDDEDGESNIILTETNSIYSIHLPHPPSTDASKMEELISVLSSHRTMMALMKPNN